MFFGSYTKLRSGFAGWAANGGWDRLEIQGKIYNCIKLWCARMRPEACT